MSSTRLVTCLLSALLPCTAAQADERTAEKVDTSFWLAPKVDLDLRSLSPAAVKLIAGPDGSRKFALLQTGDDAPSANYVPSNPKLEPFIVKGDKGYRVVAG